MSKQSTGYDQGGGDEVYLTDDGQRRSLVFNHREIVAAPGGHASAEVVETNVAVRIRVLRQGILKGLRSPGRTATSGAHDADGTSLAAFLDDLVMVQRPKGSEDSLGDVLAAVLRGLANVDEVDRLPFEHIVQLSRGHFDGWHGGEGCLRFPSFEYVRVGRCAVV